MLIGVMTLSEKTQTGGLATTGQICHRYVTIAGCDISMVSTFGLMCAALLGIHPGILFNSSQSEDKW